MIKLFKQNVIMKIFINIQIDWLLISSKGPKYTVVAENMYPPGFSVFGFCPFSQELLGLQIFYIPHWKALIRSYSNLK